jgi:undecaprenyl phosphate-alpha-L-ara4N flippase subunit ArnE
MKTKAWAIGLMIITTLLTSTAQLLYKAGAERLEFDLMSILTNYFLLSGLLLYMIGAVLMITAFKGGELSVLYPIVATSYIWVGIFSYLIFDENVNFLRWLGITSIFFGVVLVGLGSKDKKIVEEASAL